MKVTGPAVIWQKSAPGEATLSFGDAYNALRSHLASEAKSNDVFAAHLEILEDPMIVETVHANVNAGMSEAAALAATRDSVVSMFEHIDDEYLRARVDDVRDVFGQLQKEMCGGAHTEAQVFDKGSVLVADELLPSDASAIDFDSLAGILCNKGSSTSHVCIIAHSKGVPIQVGVDISAIAQGDIVSVDDPMVGGHESVATKLRSAGRKLYVNAGNVDDIRRGIAAGADGVGLFRTEFLFLERDSMPDMEEQRKEYRDALLACEGKVLILRTMDLGGDKLLPYLPLPVEENPFLGLRGVRCCLAHLGLLQQQLGAVIEAARDVRGLHPDWFSAGSPMRLMLPMVCTVDEILQVKDVMRELAPDFEELVQTGVMIETPAAVLDAPALAEESAFFSIGSNDLTQYIMAADRGNPYVSYLYDPYSPAMKRAMELTVQAAHGAGIPVGICGELASDPRATDYLLALGLDSLSVSHL